MGVDEMKQIQIPTIEETLVDYDKKLAKQQAEYCKKNKKERMRKRYDLLNKEEVLR